jgi:predicted metal-binding membrane protein
MSTVAMTTWQFPPPIYGGGAGGQWTSQYWLIMAVMWWVMMIAMMVPSATPVILLYARVFRHNQRGEDAGAALAPTSVFLLGYLLAWLFFSVGATGLQWALEKLGLVHGMMMWSNSRLLSALFLLAAGAYQLSPLKYVCLNHCRSPVAWLTAHWRAGRGGALRMGLSHGLYCVGCCWFLMLLLFVGGIMNLVWIAGLAIFVLLEKQLPRGIWVARVSGGLMMLAAVWLLLAR